MRTNVTIHTAGSECTRRCSLNIRIPEYRADMPEAFRLSTSISGGYSNSSCSSARSLFSAALSCNPYFFCRGCKTARSSFVPTYFRSGHCHDICLRRCSCSALLHTRSAQLCMNRLCTGFRGRSGVPHRKIRDTLTLYFRQLQRITRLSYYVH